MIGHAHYDGTTGMATFHRNGETFGPIALSIDDFHVISRAIEAAREEGYTAGWECLSGRVRIACSRY